MRWSLLVVIALALLLPGAARSTLSAEIFVGPGPGLTGNDTGGIIAYSPNLGRGIYRAMATDWCARWGRLSYVTSVHRKYGDYVSFVCMDRPRVIH
jgi:hypothetical protein